MAGGSAVARDESEHEVEVERGGVGRSQIPRDEDEWRHTRRHAGCWHAAQPGDDALSHIREVGGPLGHVPAHLGQHNLVGTECVEYRALTGRTRIDPRSHIIDQRRIRSHHGRGF